MQHHTPLPQPPHRRHTPCCQKKLPAGLFYDIPPEAEGIEYVIERENAVAKPMQEWFGINRE
jgi:hypothetical protein